MWQHTFKQICLQETSDAVGMDEFDPLPVVAGSSGHDLVGDAVVPDWTKWTLAGPGDNICDDNFIFAIEINPLDSNILPMDQFYQHFKGGGCNFIDRDKLWQGPRGQVLFLQVTFEYQGAKVSCVSIICLFFQS